MRPADKSRVALLERRIGASLERIWENVLDWAHLPWLHAQSFARIELLDEGEWGWRARIATTLSPDDPFVTELCIERDARRYVARTVEGPGSGSEIWTLLSPVADHATDIEVGFWVPDVAGDQARALGELYLALYTRLWDEDEAMMQQREAALAARRGPRAGRGARIALGPVEAIRPDLPACFEAGGGRWRVIELDGRLLAHAALCPHLLGPLEDAPDVDGGPHELRCPWHGYRFDLQSGRSSDGRGLRMPTPPRVEVDDGTLVLVWAD